MTKFELAGQGRSLRIRSLQDDKNKYRMNNIDTAAR